MERVLADAAYVNAVEAGDALVEAFLEGTERRARGRRADEIHVVYTEFKSMLEPDADRQADRADGRRVHRRDPQGPASAVYDFEPSAEALLGAMLPKYVKTRLFSAMLEAAASESAARRTAMKAATDNATELVKTSAGRRTRPVRPRSPRRSARSSVAPPRLPVAQEVMSDMSATAPPPAPAVWSG